MKLESLGPTNVRPLLSADEIFDEELGVIGNASPGDSVYISHYSLPQVHEGKPLDTDASKVQRHVLDVVLNQLANKVKIFVIADNSKANSPQGGDDRRNEKTIRYLREMGVYVLSYPARFVSINHTKLIARNGHAVITSANLSSHSADSPDDNTGFKLTGRGAHNGIIHSFLPQWNFAVREDMRGWAKDYPKPNPDPVDLVDEKVLWMNTAPKEESQKDADITEIFDGYRRLIHRAASGPADAALYFEHFDVSNLQLLRHLLYARHANPTLDIRFIIDPNQYLQGFHDGTHDVREVAYEEIKKAGIPLRFARVKPHPNGSVDPQRFHDKFVVYRDKEIINGSGNFSSHSLNGNGLPDSGKKPKLHNREVDVLVRDPDSARAYREKFLNDWEHNTCENPHEAAGEGSVG